MNKTPLRFLLPAALAIALLAPDAARAMDADGAYGMGAGAGVSCGTWTSNRRTSAGWYQAGQWALGFLTGVGFQGVRAGVNPLLGVDADGVWAWLDNYCQTHPLKWLPDATAAFVDEHPR